MKKIPFNVRPADGPNHGWISKSGSPYPVRHSPQMASEVAVPEVATFRPRILQEACGRQSSGSSVSEKLPAGHD